MTSSLPYENRLVYLIQTKLSVHLTDDLRHDIASALYNYGRDCVKVTECERDQWKVDYFRKGERK
jgi:hypothetical protein